MMNILEEAIIYATVKHQGKVRKLGETPYILHPLEVAQILSTMTDDLEIITAGILGIPTAISFGIVAVGERYGSMYELVDSAKKCGEIILRLISRKF